MFSLNLLAAESSFYPAEILAIIIVLFVYIMTIWMSVGIAVASYVLQSVSIRQMLKSVGFGKAWYAFVPFCNVYSLGYLADSYDDGKEKTNYAKKLLKLFIAYTAFSYFALLCMIFIMIFAVTMIDGASSLMISPFLMLATYAIYFAMVAFAAIYTVQLMKALWRIYRIFAPEKAVLFLMLSIFVSAAPIILFIIRKREPHNLRTETTDAQPLSDSEM